MHKQIKHWTTLCFVMILLSCNDGFTIKKEGYHKILFPEKKYTKFDEQGYPYTFEYPLYAHISKGSNVLDENQQNPFSINIEFPDFKAKIFMSYKDLTSYSTYKVKSPSGVYRDSIGKNDFMKMVDDAYNLAYKNEIKAQSITDSAMRTPNGLSGIYFELSGNVATANQFFLSDTTRHFLRGALYFDATPNEDSLKPVNNFLKQDVMHIINTMKWK